MGVTQARSVSTNEWLTPPEIIKGLGDFGLDPCAPCSMAHISGPKPWATAGMHFCKCDRSLSAPWPKDKRVWLNPPYDREISSWLKKLVDHGDGVAMVFAHAGAYWFQDFVFGRAHAVLFLAARLKFYGLDGIISGSSARASSALVAYGQRNAESLRTLQIRGHFIWLR